MNELELSAMLLRRAISELELSGKLGSNKALELIEKLYEIEELVS